MLRSIFRTADRFANSLMTHRSDIIWIDVSGSAEEILKLIQHSNHTQFPVCEKSLDKVVGIVSTKDILIQLSSDVNFNIRTITREPMFVPETMPALELLEKFRVTRTHVALVLNEYGALEGMVTLHDVVEAIFGDIPLTKQSGNEIVQRGDGSWLIDGMMQTPRWSDHLDIHDLTGEDTGSYTTLGGFVMHQLGRVPQAAECFDFHGYHFEVMDMDGMRVDKVLVKKNEQSQEALPASNKNG